MLPVHFEGGNEATSWCETYWEQNASAPSVAAICRKAAEAWVMLLVSVATSSMILHLFSSFECKTGYKYSFINIKIQKNFQLSRSCLKQNTILTDRKMYLGLIWAQGKWCGQIKVHYHACAATCAYPTVSIPPSCNGFGALTSKNSRRSLNNLTLLYGM